MKKRGQVSIEYILIVAFAFALTIPLFGIFQQKAVETKTIVSDEQLFKAGTAIIDAVNQVYYYGPPAKQTLRVYFPSNIVSVDINGKSIIFTMDAIPKDYDVSFTADTTINPASTIKKHEGIHSITITAQQDGSVKLEE
ncbi:hypothetical protein D6783_01925 [Candidatus Woesearchaeota archaeon]|nr:MAG: hypothetical protein D6783_01925 [Candidatus Woesearchaeota archaeon]